MSLGARHKSPSSALKRVLPKSLFGLALLILVVPMLLVQLVAIYIFYERHWASINRHMASALAGEVVMISQQVKELPPQERQSYFSHVRQWTGLKASYENQEKASLSLPDSERLPLFDELQNRLQNRLQTPFSLQSNGEAVLIRIAQDGGILTIEAPRKRLASSTTYIFVMWMVGASAVLLLVAVLFLRNQIRPITRLAQAAENFGRGQDSPDFRPHGAQEVRQAARAFINMRERITRQMTGRVEMLAGISHDLRTPLTRIKLQLEMLGDDRKITALKQDIAEMEHMIAEYLDYARGEGGEQAQSVWLGQFLQAVVKDFERQGAAPELHLDGEDIQLALKINAMRRCLANIIENALRFGSKCEITARIRGRYIRLLIDDDGPGIPESSRETVFQPFKKLDGSRKLGSNSGVGLGLAIVRDIVLAHGGEITLEDSPHGGLRVAITLPR